MARILIVLGEARAFTQVDSAVRRLSAAGHRIELLAPASDEDRRRAADVLVRCDRLAGCSWELTPPGDAPDAWLDARPPDVVVAAPARAEHGIESYVRAAANRAIPTVALAGPDGEHVPTEPIHGGVVAVWNEWLASGERERWAAGDERLRVTGAPAFDMYFNYRPGRHREVFCVEVGLDHRRPFAVFVEASAGGSARAAPQLAAQLADALSGRDVRLLVWPDPDAATRWDDAPNLTVWRHSGLAPGSPPFRRELGLALSHGVAAVSSSPLALLEALALDRPCVLLGQDPDPRSWANDLASTGFAERAPDPARGAEAILASLHGEDRAARARREAAVTALRPAGRDEPAGALLARLIDEQASPTESWGSDAAAPRPSRNGLSADPELAQLARARSEDPVAVRQPLALISQIQRSGGTLLSQLLDGHPQCHVHPHELHIGHPFDKDSWPELDPTDGPKRWLAMLRERHSERAFAEGYRKYARRERRPGYEGEQLETHPFLLPPATLREVFHRCARARHISSARDVVDCYMTAYFNAWLDNRNLEGDKRWVVAFAARLGVSEDNQRRLFADYPDGRLVCVLRDPVSWYASARSFRSDRYADVARALRLWRWSAAGISRAAGRYGDRVLVVRFERLVGHTEETMRRVAAFLDIDFEPGLLVPTFNGQPIKANSSFPVHRHGVLSAPLRRRESLPDEVVDHIEREAGEMYREVAALADQ